jgi:hypothetical protein
MFININVYDLFIDEQPISKPKLDHVTINAR